MSIIWPTLGGSHPAVPDATAGEPVEAAAAEEETPMLISAQTEVPAGGYVVDTAGHPD